MDTKIQARFYQVENIGNGDATLFDCLHRLWDHPRRNAYETIYGNARVRIESFNDDARRVGQGFVDGEFVRQQVENIPPVAEQGLPLEGNVRPLGHRCAFRYHAQLNVLLLESRREAVTPMRMDALIKARLNPHRGFFLSPVLSPAALERLRAGTPRRVTFRVARPADMHAVEDEDARLEDNLARLQNLLGGPNIEVTASWPQGNRDGRLDGRAIGNLVRWAIGNRDHVEKVQVKISEETDPIDIFSEQLKSAEILDLDNENVGRNYAARQDFLSRSFEEHAPTLMRLFG